MVTPREGRGRVATGAAQRNPWEKDAPMFSAPKWAEEPWVSCNFSRSYAPSGATAPYSPRLPRAGARGYAPWPRWGLHKIRRFCHGPAEALQADVLLTCDDRLCRLGRRLRKDLTVRVADLLEWSKEVWNAPDIE